MEDEDPQTSPEASSSQTTYPGVVLPHRSASIKLHQKSNDAEHNASSDVGGGIQRRDSLKHTEDFYGVRPTSPGAGSKTWRPGSHISSVQGRQRFNSRTSGFSGPSRPLSPELETTSPKRTSAPLPIPRGFFTPRKPTSAIRLEQKERAQVAAETEDRLQSHFEQVEQSPSDHVTNSDIKLQPIPPISNVNRHTPDSNPSPRMTNRSLRQSVTDISTLRTHDTRNIANRSSEDLVNTKTDQPPARTVARGRIRKHKRIDNPLTTWFCGGHMMTGGDSIWSMGLILLLLFGITGVWLGTTGVWLWIHGREYGLAKGADVGIVIVFVYLFGVVFSSLLVSAFRDPGIIPRNLDPNPPLAQDSSYYEPMPREITVGMNRVPVKYCETCKSYRPPRSSHCRLCGNCVDGIDHHCSYIHTCVGKRNYFSFLTLLVSSSIASIYEVVFSALHFALLCHHDHISFSHALSESPGAAVSFLLGVLILPGIFFLLYYHVRLLVYNLTTVEQIRANASSSLFFSNRFVENPFAQKSLLTNMLVASLGRPQFPSWIDASGWHVDDQRRVNPALTDVRYAKEDV